MAARRVGILVLGMHRSGSSAITRMLNLLGCTLPQTPMPLAFDNPMGHWESQRVADFNDELLGVAGTQWHDWVPVNPRLSETLVWPQLVARGREVLRQEFADAPLFVLKDPRICKLGNFWLEVLAAERIDPAFVLPIRNPLEVARSLSTRDGIDEHQVLLIWLRHVLAAEAASRGQTRVFTDFTTLLDHWEELSVRLSTGLNLVWPRISTLSGAEISQFLTPELRHHVSNTAELSNNPAISPWIRTAYEVLLGWARDGEKAADYPILDQISREFDSAGAIFARPLLNAGLAAGRAAEADAQRAAMAEERDAVARRLGEVEADFGQAQAERAAMAEDRASVARRLGEVEAEFAQAQAERHALTVQRDEYATAGAALAADRDSVAGRLGEVEAALAHTSNERDQLAIEHAEERVRFAGRVGEIEAQLADATASHDEARARIDGLGDELTTAHAAADALKDHLGISESTLRQREEEIAQIGEDLAAAERLREATAADNARNAARSTQMERDLADAQAKWRKAEDRASQAETRTEAHKRELAGRISELAETTKLLRNRDSEVEAAKVELTKAQARVESRFAEIAKLTRLYGDQQQQTETQRAQVDWLVQVHTSLAAIPQWWSFMPPGWRRKRELPRLRRAKLFDGDAYLARHPDVVEEGMDPLRHYIMHGMAEGRERA